MRNFDPILFIENPNPMLIFDQQSGQILDVNKASIEKYGYVRDEFLNMNINQLRHEDDIPQLNQVLKQNIRIIQKPGVWRHIDHSGQIIYVKIASSSIQYEHHDAMLESINDVSDIYQVKEDLRYHFNNSPVALIEWDGEFRIIGWSKKARELFGWTEETVKGKSPNDFPFVHKRSLVKLKHLMEEANKGESGLSLFNMDLYTKDGKLINTEWLNTIKYDANGNLLSALTRIKDLTRIKESEKTIKLLTNAVKAAENGIVITDSDGKIEWVNQAVLDFTGYSEEEMLGNNPSILKSGKQDQKFYKDLWKTIKSGKVWHGHLINRKKDGTTYFEEETITPVRNEQDKISHFIAIKQDITKRIESEQKLRKSLKEKEILLSEIHHRVKNNLAIVSSLLEMQLFNAKNEELKETLSDSMMRIKSIAIIHEQIYNLPQLSAISFNEYTKKLVKSIQSTFSSDEQNIEILFNDDEVNLNNS